MVQMLRASCLLWLIGCTPSPDLGVRWSEQQAWEWAETHPWPVGVNYVPRTASNTLEMWQADTWDPATIEQELGWSRDLGFNSLRVFLSDLAWEQDPEGFLDRVDQFLALADESGHSTLLVIWDGVWDPFPVPGPQLEPIPGVHNSRWVQSPGADVLADDEAQQALQPYVEAVVSRFRDDGRILGWDLFNEADQPNSLSYLEVELPPEQKTAQALALMQRTETWVRALEPTQPLTTGLFAERSWGPEDELDPIVDFMIHHSDILSFHSYADAPTVAPKLDDLEAWGRPIWCTEYMGRPQSTFDDLLPAFRQRQVGAFSWGLVSGRTQTIYPWVTWVVPLPDGEPETWFHDVLHPDGSPWDPEEAAWLQSFLQTAE